MASPAWFARDDGVIDAGGMLVVWRGPSPQVVTNALGREVVVALDGTVAIPVLAEDLESVGLGDAMDLRSAIGGLIQVLEAEGLAVPAEVGPGETVDTAAAALLFLRRWVPSGGTGVLVPALHGSVPQLIVERDPASDISIGTIDTDPPGSVGPVVPSAKPDVLVAIGGGALLVSVGGIHQCVRQDATGAGTAEVLAEAILVATNTKAGRPVVSAFVARGGSAVATPVRESAGMPGTVTVLDGVSVTRRTGTLEPDGRVRFADGISTGPPVLQVPAESGDVVDLVTDGSRRVVAPSAHRVVRPHVRWRIAATGSVLEGSPAATRYATEFLAVGGDLLRGMPSSRSVKVYPGGVLDDRQLWAMDAGRIEQLGVAGLARLLDRLGAPPALVRSGIDLTGAQELLLGYELDHGVPAHKFYVVGLTPECHTDLCRALEVGTSTPGPPTFFSVKWHTGGAHRWWTAEYRMPPAGLTPVRAVEDSFDLPEHWRWMHALLQLVAPTVLRPTGERGTGWPITMHPANLLVMYDSQGRRSVDLRARRTEHPEDVWPVLSWLSAVAGLTPTDEERLLGFGAGGQVERAIGGTTGDDRPFVSLYRAASVEVPQ